MYYKQDFKQYLEKQGKYSYAIIDPPWHLNSQPPGLFKNQLTYTLWNNADLHLLLSKLDVDFVFLWVINSMVPEVFKAMENTDFKYKTCATWIKTTTTGKLAYGLGNTFRNCTEQLFVLVRGKQKALNLNLRNAYISRSAKRTIKPKEFEKELVNRLATKQKVGIYIFSGGPLDFIDSVDILEEGINTDVITNKTI